MSLFAYSILDSVQEACKELSRLPLEEQVQALNQVRTMIHKAGPFANEPVDLVLWVPLDKVEANDYNPNSVAPPEMKLLERSIDADGYTQPIVSWPRNGVYEVVDGFHRNRVGRESKIVRKRIHGYLPLTVIRDEQQDKSDRMASTIRHNRARGKHRVESMSDIVIELKRRNWSDERIARDLGMDQDEILRLCQITGLAEMFSDREFSASWDVEGNITEDDFKGLTDEVSDYGEDSEKFRTVNTSDETRIFHTYDKWECHKAGFYATTLPGISKEEAEAKYAEFLSDNAAFGSALERVTSEWKHSCEHYLTNKAMNRIAWLGQASVCLALGIPSTFRGGFNLLAPDKQESANQLALLYLNRWLVANNLPQVSMEEAYSGERQSVIY
jgi:hypothetical protein